MKELDDFFVGNTENSAVAPEMSSLHLNFKDIF